MSDILRQLADVASSHDNHAHDVNGNCIVKGK